jgi:SAM-dependent methyltransferase
MDIWGRIYLDHWRGESHPHTFIRDDGNISVVETAAGYFEAPRGATDEAACSELRGRVLDLGCGAGSYSLLLEGQGQNVVGIDASPGAIEVCRERGCRDARVMDFSELRFRAGEFDAIICMGNTLGISQSPETLPMFLRELGRLVRPEGTLLAAVVDPLDTTDPANLSYHEQNRAAGRPPGLVRARIEYRGQIGDWWQLWLPTEDELREAIRAGGWSVDSSTAEGPSRLWLLKRDHPD